ncbi:hypothetical protein [Pseudomonas sp. M30-35]|uniref:hypothetical protein n=1 Tax=Pseudomonas sp. M30-35 TaxID=1981174 RepID=UPI000B3C4988|nr:hypothetical protein [Pseudomonas sp. M30-35]ARU90241.1 hypothetical protein B9K09_20820 [Pseudomonas sp. M30-35]
MKLPPLRAQHWLIFAGVAFIFFSWGAWLMRGPQMVEPLAWLQKWQTDIFDPLAADQLTLMRLSSEVEEDGELWLQPRLDGSRLLYRSELQADDQAWAVEARIALSDDELVSLMAAVGVDEKGEEQPLSAQLVRQLGHYEVIYLSLKPLEAVATQRIISSLGQPKLSLELQEGGQALVYPERGLTVHTLDDEVGLLFAVPRRLLE